MSRFFAFLFSITFIPVSAQIITGAEQPDQYMPLLEGKRVGLVVNTTSKIGNVHLVDFLNEKKVKIAYVFAPEHGFRGNADAGEHLKDYYDPLTNCKVVSLFGDKKKPSKEEMNEIDLLVFDIQDVGVRFYTYISTLHYVIEACAEHNKPLLVLDRPNPNGMSIDGPILEEKFKSFIGIHPIPVLHGLTIGELSRMIVGESWVKGFKSELKVVTCKNYTHQTEYQLPVKPSPNLPNQHAIKWYASLCFFEGTPISMGRGTYFPFQVIGYPDPAFGKFTFTPQSIQGMSKNPPHLGKTCYGVDLRTVAPPDGLSLKYLLDFYSLFPDKNGFFQVSFFDKLAGTDQLRKDIIAGKSESQIKETWKPQLEVYKKLRKKYLLYSE